jgi:hypothetical protein
MYFIDPNGNYPRHYGDIKLDNPAWQVESELPAGWVLVTDTDAPACADDETFYELPPVQIDGQWHRAWATRKLTAEEIDARQETAITRN